MIDLHLLPTINAILNGASAILVFIGILLIRRGRPVAHKRVMLAAVVTSSLFLVSYIYYHAHVGSVHFPAQGWPRPVYFTILTSHTLLAIVTVPLVLITVTRALRGRFDRHRASARWTYPIWLYVSVTGVVVYLMLYHLFARPTIASIR
jgi:putative membrane protein